jgi:hypothetical protein
MSTMAKRESVVESSFGNMPSRHDSQGSIGEENMAQQQ